MGDRIGGELGDEEPRALGEPRAVRDASVVQLDQRQLPGEAGAAVGATETLSERACEGPVGA